VRSVVAIASYKQMGGFPVLKLGIGVERVREPRSHVRDKKAFLVFEARGKLGAGELTLHPVAGEVVSPNTVSAVVGLMIVHNKFLGSIVVNVSVGH